jgi:hypothetical protein
MILTLHIELPDLDEIFDSGCPVPIARKGDKWQTSCLGKMCKEKGIYVIHHDRRVIYVGKTEGGSMNYGMRLRREFQENAAQGKHIYPKLSSLITPPDIKTTFYPILEIIKRMQFEGQIYRPDQMIGIFEIAMINHLEPQLQQHFFRGVAKMLVRFTKERGMKPLTEHEIDDFTVNVGRIVKDYHSRTPIQDSVIAEEKIKHNSSDDK